MTVYAGLTTPPENGQKLFGVSVVQQQHTHTQKAFKISNNYFCLLVALFFFLLFIRAVKRVSGCITFGWVTHWQRHQVHTRTNTCCSLSALSDYLTKALTLCNCLSINEGAQLEPQGCDWHWEVKMSFRFRFRCQIRVLCEIYPVSKSLSWKAD